MRVSLLTSVLLCVLVLPAGAARAATSELPGAPSASQPAAPQQQSRTASPRQFESRQSGARWLAEQLHHPLKGSQILVAPEMSALEGCRIARLRSALSHSTALSLRCPGHALPQLVLLKIPLSELSRSTADAVARAATADAVRTPVKKAPLLVRAGAPLEADWRTPAMHAEMPVIALDSGAAGAEIRVRIANTNHIVRARILDAHNVAIVAMGA